MRAFQFIFYVVLVVASTQYVNAKNLEEYNILSNTEVDSVVVTILPDIYTSRNVTRNDFDEWKKISSEIIIRGKTEIKQVLDSFKKCNVDSILPYNADRVMKKMKIVKKSNKFYTFWFDDDKLDIRCRVLLFTKNEVLVAWFSQTGLFDIETYKCSGGEELLNYFRNLAKTKESMTVTMPVEQTHMLRDYCGNYTYRSRALVHVLTDVGLHTGW